jgi:hypothetical protein
MCFSLSHLESLMQGTFEMLFVTNGLVVARAL